MARRSGHRRCRRRSAWRSQAATFYCWSVVWQRSGGVHVTLSRTTRPGLAFVFTLLETVILLYYAALAASLIVSVGLCSCFATVGAVSGSDTLLGWAASVSKPAGVFWIGAALAAGAALIPAMALRRAPTVLLLAGE